MTKAKRNILMVVLSSVSPDVRVEKEARYLVQEGNEVTIAAIDRTGELPETEERDGYTIIRMSSKRKSIFKYFEFWKNVKKRFSMQKYNILHLHDLNVLPLASKLKNLSDIVIYDSHENFPEQMSETFGLPALIAYTWLEKRYLKKVDNIITAAPTVTDTLKRKYNTKSEWVSNYPSKIDVEKAHVKPISSRYEKKTKFRVVYFGVMYKNLGYDKTVETVEILREKLSSEDIEFLIIGSGPALEPMGKLISEKSLSDYFTLTGWMDYLDALSILRTCDMGLILFQPGKNNFLRMPNRLYDYCSAGVPFIGSNFEGLQRAIEGMEKFGELIDPTSPREIAKTILDFYNNKDKLDQMKINAQQAYFNRYNWELEAEKIVKTYESAYLEKTKTF